MRKTDETRNYFLEEKKKSECISRKHKKVCTNLNYVKHFLTLASEVIGCI